MHDIQDELYYDKCPESHNPLLPMDLLGDPCRKALRQRRSPQLAVCPRRGSVLEWVLVGMGC